MRFVYRLPDEKACAVCGASLAGALSSRDRHPNELCPACMNEAVDWQGHPLVFYNVDACGGYVAVRRATGQKSDDHICFVRGLECWADEAKFGGIVVMLTRGRG